MSTLHFVGGEKGGVGKSFTSRLLAQYLIDSGQTFTGFDTDSSHSTFSRFYGDYTTKIDTDNTGNMDVIVELAEQQADSNIIVDLAAQTTNKLLRWMEETDLIDTLDELNCQIFYWHVMDDGADSVYLLEKLLERFNNSRVQIVVVQNHGRGKNYKPFESSSTFLQAKQSGARFMLVPSLHGELVNKIDFANLSFWAAANNTEHTKITDRKRIKVWLNFIYEQMRKCLASVRNEQDQNRRQGQSQEQSPSTENNN